MKKPNFKYDSSLYNTFVPDEVASAIARWLGVRKSDITLDARFVEDLCADSLDVVGLAMEFEEEYDIALSDSDLEHCYTVRDLVELINEKKEAS
jgi:acyl carrier protein